MNTTRITINRKLLKIYYGTMVFFGTVIVAGHVILYLTGQLSDDWHMFALFGTILFVGGVLFFSGLFTPSFPEIVLTNHSMQLKRYGGFPFTSYQWDKLKSVELTKNKITIQFANTGLKDSMRIPFSFRYKKIDELQRALVSKCEQNGVNFVKNF
jgi:hypothetical protein